MIEIFQSWDKSKPVPFKSFTFSGGEVHVKIEHPSYPWTSVQIKAHLTSSEEIMKLAMVNDALQRQFYGRHGMHVPINLQCPYLPYARQDRVMQRGEALGLRVICDLINAMDFTSVEVWDVHSDSALALLNNAQNYGPETFVQMIPTDKKNTILVAPDAGAMKKVGKVATGLGFKMISAEKKRDTETGDITGTKVHSDPVGDKDFLIVDDISSAFSRMDFGGILWLFFWAAIGIATTAVGIVWMLIHIFHHLRWIS